MPKYGSALIVVMTAEPLYHAQVWECPHCGHDRGTSLPCPSMGVPSLWS